MSHFRYNLYISWAQVFQQMCREKKIPEKRDSIFSKMKTIRLMSLLIGIDNCVILCGRLAREALARVLRAIGGVAQALSEQGGGVINSD